VNKPLAFDVLALPLLGRFWRWRHARTLMQVPLFLVALVIVWDGLTGSPLAPRNLATILPWLHYRGFVVLALLVFGNAFCMACPFMLPRNLVRRFIQPTRHWPVRLRNKWVAVVLFVLFLFIYERYDLWSTPWWTAWLVVAYFAAALLLDVLFDNSGSFNRAKSVISIAPSAWIVCMPARTTMLASWRVCRQPNSGLAGHVLGLVACFSVRILPRW